MAPNAVHVMITGAAGQIGYALAPMVARGVMLGPGQPVVLHLLDIEPAAQALEGVKMELLDAAFPLLHGMQSIQPIFVRFRCPVSTCMASLQAGCLVVPQMFVWVLAATLLCCPACNRCDCKHQRGGGLQGR